jgi:hypothetical protein
LPGQEKRVSSGWKFNSIDSIADFNVRVVSAEIK